MKCESCIHYLYHSPTWNDPSHEEYCKVYGDFCDMQHDNIECVKFELSDWGERKIKIFRERKLKRILEYGNKS